MPEETNVSELVTFHVGFCADEDVKTLYAAEEP